MAVRSFTFVYVLLHPIDYSVKTVALSVRVGRTGSDDACALADVIYYFPVRHQPRLEGRSRRAVLPFMAVRRLGGSWSNGDNHISFDCV